MHRRAVVRSQKVKQCRLPHSGVSTDAVPRGSNSPGPITCPASLTRVGRILSSIDTGRFVIYGPSLNMPLAVVRRAEVPGHVTVVVDAGSFLRGESRQKEADHFAALVMILPAALVK